MRQALNTLIVLGCLVLIMPLRGSAQGYDTPLTIQGVNNESAQSAASRAAGGVTLGVRNDASIMFANPALLQSVSSIQISLGGMQQFTFGKQNQLYGGLQNHSAFNLLVAGVTDWISDPDTVLGTPTAGDSVQRPFDRLGPDWNRKDNRTLPLQAFLAVPFVLGDVPVVVGAGAVQYANLNRYYQNNNCFAPSVLSVLNGTIPTGPLATNPYITQWYQYVQERRGSLFGYGIAVSGAPLENLAVGISGIYVAGTTDDYEARAGRGRMAFYNNYLRLSKENVLSYARTGTSDFTGAEFTFASSYRANRLTVGFSLKPPTTLTRSFSSQTLFDSVTAVSLVSHRVDSLHVLWSAVRGGEDRIELPWRGTVGLSIDFRENVTLGLEYEMRPLAAAVYTGPDGVESEPWLSASLWHVGAEYRPADWIALRGGVRENAEGFEPLSNAIRGEAVKYTIYSLGAGFSFANIRLAVAYEYSDMKYVDAWSNAASVNREFRNTVVASVAYDIAR